MRVAGCPLCDAAGGTLVFQGEAFRVIRANEAGFPAFWRLVWTRHVAEFSELSAAERSQCMEAVATIESVVRAALAPTKINLAALGNVVPHLHWHVIARFERDTHFPAPVWAAASRDADVAFLADIEARCAEVDKAICAALARA
jgi:diadenosine tetraphosphate (Ap4A) HIT family hydrolase